MGKTFEKCIGARQAEGPPRERGRYRRSGPGASRQGGSLACAALALGLLSPVAACADEELNLSLGYDGRLLVKVLDIEVEARADRGGYDAEAQLTSSGILALVKHIHQVASSQGRIEAGELRPGQFETQNLGGKTHRRIHTTWSRGQVVMTATPSFDDLGDPPASLQQKLAAADPLTQLMRLTLNGSREKSCARSYLFFDGKQLYALDFGPAGDAAANPREQRLGLQGAFQCDVRYREVAGFKKKPPDKRNQGLRRPITLRFGRLGASGPLLITSLSAETPLGRASIDLERVRGVGAPPG